MTHHRVISADSPVPDLPRLLNSKIGESDMGTPIGTSVHPPGPQWGRKRIGADSLVISGLRELL